MKPDQLRELLAIGYNGQVPFAEFVRMVDKAFAAELDDANAKIERLHEGIRRAARGKCSRPGCDNVVPVPPPWCSVACMDEHVGALPPSTPGKEWKCGECGYVNTAAICTKCGGIFT